MTQNNNNDVIINYTDESTANVSTNNVKANTNMSHIAEKYRSGINQIHQAREEQRHKMELLTTQAQTLLVDFKRSIESNEKIIKYIKSISVAELKSKLAKIIDDESYMPDSSVPEMVKLPSDQEKISRIVRVLVRHTAQYTVLRDQATKIVTELCNKFQNDFESLIAKLIPEDLSDTNSTIVSTHEMISGLIKQQADDMVNQITTKFETNTAEINEFKKSLTDIIKIEEPNLRVKIFDLAVVII